MRKNRFVCGISTVLLIGSCILFLLIYVDYKNSLAIINTEIGDISYEYTNSVNESTEKEMVTDVDITNSSTINVLYSQANESGLQVKDLETEFAEQLYVYGTDSENWEDAREKMDDIIIKLQKYFLDSNATTDPWYVCDPTKLVPNWNFYADLNYSNDSIKVLWTCTDDNDDLLVVITGYYSLTDKVFYNISKHSTQLSDNYRVIDYEDDYAETDDDNDSENFLNDIDSIIDAINEYIEQTPVENDGTGVTKE